MIPEFMTTPLAAARDLASRISDRNSFSMGNENEASDGTNLARDMAMSEEEKEAPAGENPGENVPVDATSEGGPPEVLGLEAISEKRSHSGSVSLGSQARSQHFSGQNLDSGVGVPHLEQNNFYDRMPSRSPNPRHHTHRNERRDDRRDRRSGRDNKIGNDLSDILGELDLTPPSRPRKRGETADQSSKFVLSEGVPDDEVARSGVTLFKNRFGTRGTSD